MPAKPLLSGDELISNNGVFALGFFSLGNSTTNSYLGIWYHNIPERTYVWVANRDNPISGSLSGKLVLTNGSSLVLSDSKGRILWTTANNVTTGGDGAVALLLDTGNFILQSRNFTQIWQSFDHPTDTILPGFKLWANYKTHTALRIVAWKDSQDPSTGKFILSRDPSTGLQILIWRETSLYWRSGLWKSATASDNNGYMWSEIVDDGGEIYSTYNTDNISHRSHMKLDYTGNLILRRWINQSWEVLFKRPGDGCRHYGSCGPFGYCDSTESTGKCRCLDGFVPADGFSANFSRGCVRKEALRCQGDHFKTLSGMKVPENFVYVGNRSFEECTADCDRNCSCTAFAYANLSSILATGGPSRCLVWIGELVDTEKSGALGGNLYLRLAGSPGMYGSMSYFVLLTCRDIGTLNVCRYHVTSMDFDSNSLHVKL
jgi:hypothetical protein